MLHQCASRRICRIETIFEAWFRYRRCGYVVGLGGRRRFLSLSAAGWRRWFNAAERPRLPLRRSSGGVRAPGGNRQAFGYWRRCLGTRTSQPSSSQSCEYLRLAPLAEADSGTPRPSRYTKADAHPLTTSRDLRRRGSGEDANGARFSAGREEKKTANVEAYINLFIYF